MLVLLSQTAPTKDGMFLPLSKNKKAPYVNRMLSGWTEGVRNVSDRMGKGFEDSLYSGLPIR
jgi:hypothetical protein